jgi:hypothetical protein
MPKLEELGRHLYESGKKKFADWAKGMAEYGGEAWKNFRSYAAAIWDKASKPLQNERGSVSIGDRKGKAAAAEFANDLEKSLVGKIPGNLPLRMGRTSEVLKMSGADDLPVVMRQNKAKEVMSAGDHGLSKETLLSIPEQLHDPIMVLDSSTQGNSLVVVTQLFDKGKPVVAAVHLNKRAGRLEINEVASVYGRSGAARYIEREIDTGKLRYINKTKSSAWSRGLSGLQLPAVMQHAKRFDGKRILTERDIVKGNVLNNERGSVSIEGLRNAKETIKDAKERLKETKELAEDIGVPLSTVLMEISPPIAYSVRRLDFDRGRRRRRWRTVFTWPPSGVWWINATIWTICATGYWIFTRRWNRRIWAW